MKKGALTDEMSRRRKAIYNGLNACLNQDDAIKATEIWMQEFSSKPLYALQPFLSRIIEALDIDVQRSAIQQHILNSLLNESGHQLDVPTSAQPAEFEQEVRRPLQKANASHKVFTYFMDYFLAALFKSDSASELSIKVYVFDNAHRTGISGENMDKVKKWLSENGQVSLISELTLQQMQALFHLFYVASCEHIGPVNTDRLIAESVKIVEQLPESAEFSVRSIF
jgi:hypothetical protein